MRRKSKHLQMNYLYWLLNHIEKKYKNSPRYNFHIADLDEQRKAAGFTKKAFKKYCEHKKASQ